MSQNLHDGLLDEIKRVEKIIEVYKTVPGGAIAAVLMQGEIEQARAFMAEPDVVGMLRAYNSLKGWEL